MASNGENTMFTQIIKDSSLTLPGAIVPRRRGSIRQVVTRPDRAVICESRTRSSAVIPVQAWIHRASLRKCATDRLDSRLRGEWPGLANMVIKSEIGGAYPLEMLKMKIDPTMCMKTNGT